MATAEINMGARIWVERRAYLEGTSTTATVVEQTRTHSVVTMRTVGYEDYETAETAAESAAGAGVVATVERDGVMYAVLVETDTTGSWE